MRVPTTITIRQSNSTGETFAVETTGDEIEMSGPLSPEEVNAVKREGILAVQTFPAEIIDMVGLKVLETL